MEDDFWLSVSLIGVGIFIGYLIWGTSSAQEQLNDLRIEYNSLNQTYNNLKIEYLKLQQENQALIAKQKTLEQQITTYIIEQATMEALSLGKYQLLWGLIKIPLCQDSPNFILC